MAEANLTTSRWSAVSSQVFGSKGGLVVGAAALLRVRAAVFGVDRRKSGAAPLLWPLWGCVEGCGAFRVVGRLDMALNQMRQGLPHPLAHFLFGANAPDASY